jgi:hypothetical protein
MIYIVSSISSNAKYFDIWIKFIIIIIIIIKLSYNEEIENASACCVQL